VNVGGALLPVIVSGYLIAHDGIGWQALAAVVIVGALVHVVARPVPGLGIVVPALLPGASPPWWPSRGIRPPWPGSPTRAVR
jgi:uncharacterized membrane protein